jgi:hypothetical protein
LWPIDDDINDTEGIVESKIEAPTAVNWELTNVNPIAGEAICFNSGSNADSGIITIGGNGNPTNVDLSIQSHPCP